MLGIHAVVPFMLHLLLSRTHQLRLTACCRAFGIHFAEVPFVATKQGFRREGNCRRIIKVGCGSPACQAALC